MGILNVASRQRRKEGISSEERKVTRPRYATRSRKVRRFEVLFDKSNGIIFGRTVSLKGLLWLKECTGVTHAAKRIS